MANNNNGNQFREDEILVLEQLRDGKMVKNIFPKIGGRLRLPTRRGPSPLFLLPAQHLPDLSCQIWPQLRLGNSLGNQAGGPTEARRLRDQYRKEIRSSTLRDYRSAMNWHILPKIGNIPIREIGYFEVQKLISRMSCSGKRLKNVLVPVREVFKFTQLAGIIDKNPMDLIKSPKARKPEINPLSMEEVNLFLEHVHPGYKNFFTVAFFTGMRFGEMSALKWRNVDFAHGVIKVKETRVKGEELPPKTSRSVRDINMLAPVVEALREQRKRTMGKSEYVFLNHYGRPLYGAEGGT
jgi:integrase